MGNILGKDKPLKEVLRENKRMITRAIRELDREKTGLEREEKKLTMEIKKCAKAGQMGPVKIMAKVSLRNRGRRTRENQDISTTILILVVVKYCIVVCRRRRRRRVPVFSRIFFPSPDGDNEISLYLTLIFVSVIFYHVPTMHSLPLMFATAIATVTTTT